VPHEHLGSNATATDNDETSHQRLVGFPDERQQTGTLAACIALSLFG